MLMMVAADHGTVDWDFKAPSGGSGSLTLWGLYSAWSLSDFNSSAGSYGCYSGRASLNATGRLLNYNIDFRICIFCGNCIVYCPINCLSMIEEYELSTYDRHELNYNQIALGQ
ncbi:NADH-plastoquinone oxidoreductase subunit 4 [Medicago truncatula]|uniref:NADH-plastoquinone oxidoreductase subunit 4 n=1 Tax=Medicago truncatula TaxID=3880 RepID=G7LIP2_MEDTR|nr:NADH-plastoquinone oxidoreductase subunit 4 [Medicago truncatula]